MFVECNAIPEADATDGGWRRRFREVTFGNSFGQPEAGTYNVSDSEVEAMTGFNKNDIKNKTASPEWRDAMFDIMAASYKHLFLPYANGELAGKLNLGAHYESNDDADLFQALAPEWFEATKKTLGSSQQFEEWFHKNYYVTVPDSVEMWRMLDGTVGPDFWTPAHPRGCAAVMGDKIHGKKSYWDEQGVDAKYIAEQFGQLDNDPKARNAATLIDQFGKACVGATDFAKCKKDEERFAEVLRMIPKLGIRRTKGKYRFFGYRMRKDDDPAHVAPDVDEDEDRKTATEKYNDTTTLKDEQDLLDCLEALLVRDEPLPQRYGGPTPDPPQESDPGTPEPSII